MKTAMQELREWVDTELKLLNYEHPIILSKIDALLEKEKEQIKEAFIDGEDGVAAEEYYNQTYNQNK